MRCFSRVNVASVVLNKLEMGLETFLNRDCVVLKHFFLNYDILYLLYIFNLLSGGFKCLLRKQVTLI